MEKIITLQEKQLLKRLKRVERILADLAYSFKAINEDYDLHPAYIAAAKTLKIKEGL